jgi:hypothetical protein
MPPVCETTDPAGLPRIKIFAYQLVSHSRRPRVILIGDEILAKVGGYVPGNFITTDRVLARRARNLAFYIGYRLAENYLIVPRIMGRTVQLPAIVSLVAVLIGGCCWASSARSW